MLVGITPDTLLPVGVPRRHSGDGFVHGGVTITVTGIAPYTFPYVQMVAWDSLRWGINLEAVPLDQLGRTDIVQIYLTSGSFPDNIYAPQFTQSAIVPVPEPSVWALAALAGSVALLGHRRKRSP